ncbi:MAG TPA: long-chain fatty acid--CoA ligase [Vicinamibacteria bacterium]|nr:long-chain fatty acid--CoA ligase [Vicinamibacteria bacterium]
MSAADERPWLRHYDEGVPSTIAVSDVTLPELLDRTAARAPGKVALRLFLDPRMPVPALTWAQLRERTLRFATALFQLGVRKGDRVAIMLPNCPEFVVAFYGALRIGAIPVNTNPMYVAREMREQFGDSGCETLVLLDQFFPRLREIHAATRVRRAIVVDLTEGLPWPARSLARLAQSRRGERAKVPAETDVSFFHELLRSYPPTPPGASLLPTDVALLQYTGGTTGTPKGAMLTHRNLVANGLQARSWFPRLREEHEVILGAVPLFHAYGLLSVLFLGVAGVAEIVLLPRPRPDAVLEALHRFRPTLFPGVPTLYAGIIDHPRVAEYDLRTGTQCLSGAASLPASVVERFEALTGGRLVEGYGLTETSPLTHGNPIHGERRVGSIGVPVPGTDARIVDLATGEPLPPGGEGELEVRGPQVMLGYWNRPAETAEMMHDGWLRTGDISRMDSDGYFYVVDRRKDMIDASGFKVFPREVEEVLLMHPAVREAVVAGVPDAYRGETVKAFIVLRPGATASAEEIVEFSRLHLAAFKVPRKVEFRSELPKSMVGKYLRRVLVEEERAPEAPAP